MGRCHPEVGSAARCLERLSSAAGLRAQAGRPCAPGPSFLYPPWAPLSCHLLHEPCPSPQTRWIFPSAHNALYYQTQPLSMRFVFVYVSYGAYEFCTALGT